MGGTAITVPNAARMEGGSVLTQTPPMKIDCILPTLPLLLSILLHQTFTNTMGAALGPHHNIETMIPAANKVIGRVSLIPGLHISLHHTLQPAHRESKSDGICMLLPLQSRNCLC
jgi:hypothetical protein